MRPADTTEEAEEVRIEFLRRMSATRRADIARRWSRLVDQAFEAGIRSRHPEYDDDEVHLAAARHILGDELFRLAYSGRALVDV